MSQNVNNKKCEKKLRSAQEIQDRIKKIAYKRLPDDLAYKAIPQIETIRYGGLGLEFEERKKGQQYEALQNSVDGQIKEDWLYCDPKPVAAHFQVSVSAVNSHVPYDLWNGLRWYGRSVIENGKFVKVKKKGKGKPKFSFVWTDPTPSS